MSDQFGIRFKMFPIVELTKLGGQNFKLGLYFGLLLILKMKSHLEPKPYRKANTHSKETRFAQVVHFEDTKFDPKRSLFTDLRSK